ncbi:MAG: hypothetical protein ABW039_08730 [Sphingobium sp.]
MPEAFIPTLYLNHRCPFCLKLMIYIAQAGLWDTVRLRIFEPGSAEHEATKAELAPYFSKVSFPTAEVAPGDFRNETDALIAYFESRSGKKATDMPLLDYYATGVFKQVTELFQENMRLKGGAGG